jgi:restriction system protein
VKSERLNSEALPDLKEVESVNKIPSLAELLVPTLAALKELGGSGRPNEVADQVAADLKLSEEILAEVTPTAVPRFANRVAWARFYLARAGFLSSSKQGVWTLTEEGQKRELSPKDARELFSRMNKVFQEERKKKQKGEEEKSHKAANPEAALPPSAAGYREQLREVLLKLPPEGFERLCQRLLREAGFTEVNVSGRSGDGGIDGNGLLQVNALVSFRVHFQCKRYSGSVGPSLVRDFRGAMQGRADKGIFLTTGGFSADSRKEASRDGVPPIELVDGERLLDMLCEFELGVKPVQTFEIDRSFFAEFGLAPSP